MKELLRMYEAAADAEGRVPLTGCSLYIEEGEILLLMGGMDSGRILLTEFLSGRQTLKKGQLYFRDERIRDRRIPADQILWLDNNRKMTQNLSVEANLKCLGARGTGSGGKGLQILLEEFGIPCSAGQKLAFCTKVQQVQLWFLLAFLKKCPLVCLEMTGMAFSEEEAAFLAKTMRTCCRQGISTVLSAGTENLLTSFADRIGWMENGRVEKMFYSPEEWQKAQEYRAERKNGSRREGAGGCDEDRQLLYETDSRRQGTENGRADQVFRIPETSFRHLMEGRSIGWNLMLALSRHVGTRFGFVEKNMERFLETEFRKRCGIRPDAELVQDLTAPEKKLLVLYRAMLMKPARIILEEGALPLEESGRAKAMELIREMRERGSEVLQEGKRETSRETVF